MACPGRVTQKCELDVVSSCVCVDIDADRDEMEGRDRLGQSITGTSGVELLVIPAV